MSLEPGQSLSHYRLLEKIGEGGMGVVWKAEDTVLGRTVAVKVLPAGLSRDEERRQMFFQEAKSASSVSTAHIVQVYEFGREGELDFLVMEYVEGNPLSKLLHGRPLSPRKVAALGAQIARGLARAHRAKLVHRDLKPGNLLVTPDGEVKIVDFGLATLCQRMDTVMLEEMTTRSVMGEPDEKQPRRLAGTLPYMSPEQVRLEELDGRSDIFSLGTILYEMTTGQLPFQGATTSDVMREVLKAQPEPAHDLVPTVPLELDRILTKAMAPRREERYQDVETLAVDLTRLGKELESGTSPSYADLQQELAPGRRMTRGASALIGALALAVIAIVAWQMLPRIFPRADPRRVVVLPLEVRGQEQGAEYLARQFAESIALNLIVRMENLEILPVPGLGEAGAGGQEAWSRWAQQRRAGRLLTGALTWEGDVVRASLSLVDTSANRVLWGTDRETARKDLLRLPAEMAPEVGAELGAVERKLYEHPDTMTRNPDLARSAVYLEVLMANRRWPQVVPMDTVESLVAAFPSEPDALLVAFHAFLNRAAFASDEEGGTRAEETLEVVMRLDPDAPWEEQYRAWSLCGKEKDYYRGIEGYTRVLERQDLSPPLRSYWVFDRGFWYQEQGNREAMWRDWNEARRLGARGSWSMAGALFEDGRIEEALAEARVAFALDPKNHNARVMLGEITFHLERWDEARTVLGAFCEGERTWQEGCAAYAYSLYRTGHMEEARLAAEVAEALKDSVDGPWFLAGYWALVGHAGNALRFLRREAEVNPSPLLLRGHHDLASLRGDPEFEALAAEQWAEALEHYRSECASKPGPAVCALHAVALHLAGRESEAQAVAAQAVSLEESASLEMTKHDYDALSWFHALEGNREEVIRLLRQRAELSPAQVPHALLASWEAWRLEEHRDYAWLVGDPEFDAITARLAGEEEENAQE